jgi:hypothetical protein
VGNRKGVEPGVMFFVNPTQVRSYLYDFDGDGHLVWAVSDRLQVFTYEIGAQRQLFQAEASAIPYPSEEVAALEMRQAAVGAPLFINVPSEYQIVHHLVVGEAGDIWLYVKSREQTGLLRLSPAGRVTGTYGVETAFDIMAARMVAANGRLYFLHAGDGETLVFAVELP